MSNAMKKLKMLHTFTSQAATTTTTTTQRSSGTTGASSFAPSFNTLSPVATNTRHIRTSSASHAQHQHQTNHHNIFHNDVIKKQQQGLDSQTQQQAHISHATVFSLPFKHQVIPEVSSPVIPVSGQPMFSLPFKHPLTPDCLTPLPSPPILQSQPVYSLPFKHQVVPEILTPAPTPAQSPAPTAFVLPLVQQVVPQTLLPSPSPALALTSAPKLPSPRPSYGRLPSGFCMLTPEEPRSTCVSANPTPRTSSFNFLAVNPVTLPPITQSRPQLTTAVVSSIDSKDSRQFRWDRVVNYVNTIRRAHSPTSTWLSSQQREINTPIDRQSLWDGGSCGTDGVDEFVWDDDLDDKGRRFTIPPKEETTMFVYEDCRMEIDHEDERPAKRSKSAERMATTTMMGATAAGMQEYLMALKSFELDRMPNYGRELSAFA